MNLPRIELPPVNSFDENWDKNFLKKFSAEAKKDKDYNSIINEFSKFIAANENFIPENLLILFIRKLEDKFGIDEIFVQKIINEQKALISPDKKSEPEPELKETAFLKAIRFIREHYRGLFVNSFTNEIMYVKEDKPVKLPLETLFTDLLFADIKIPKSQIFNYFYSKKYTAQKNPVLEILEQTKYNPATDNDFIEEALSYLQFPNPKNYDFDVPDFYKKMFKKWLVRAVDNAINDDSLPNKQVLILKGLQHSRKTSFFRWLFYPFSEYSIENIDLNLKDNQVKKRIASNMFILNDEFNKMPEKELQNFKRITGQETIKFKPFGQTTERVVKRRSNFISATNEPKFLTDRTGNVRYIVIEIINTKENPISEILLDNKDLSLQMWSQVYSLWKDYKNGFYNAELTPDELLKLDILNKKYYTYKDIKDAINFLYPKPDFDKKDEKIIYLSSTELLNNMKKNNAFPRNLLSGLTPQKLGYILSRNYYEKKTVRNSKNKIPSYKYRIKITE